MTDLTVSQIEEIKEEQKAYFNEIIETDKEGNDVSRSEYEQVKRGVNEGYYIDIYDGPNGKGYVIIRHEGDYLGCGKYVDGKILNHVPKERRLRVSISALP